MRILQIIPKMYLNFKIATTNISVPFKNHQYNNIKIFMFILKMLVNDYH